MGYDDLEPDGEFAETSPSGLHRLPIYRLRCPDHEHHAAAIARLAEASAKSDRAVSEKIDRVESKIDGLGEELKRAQLQLSRDLGEREATERGRTKAPQWLALAISAFVAVLSFLSLLTAAAALLLRGVHP